MTLLPTLGGYNSTVGTINSKGEIAGIAETGRLDPRCSPEVQAGGNGPQVLDFEAVVWGPDPGQIRELQPLPGDTVGEALAINESGQVVGASGTCANTMLPPIAYGSHAVLWEKDGSPRDLGNLGTAVLNIALAVNNQGQAVGFSSLKADSSPFQGTHAFLWKKDIGMQDLGTLPGDAVSGGERINDAGDVAGVSFDAEGNPRAFLWQNGRMSDLNALAPGSPLFLLFALGINSRGQVAGFGATEAGDVHAYLATPAAVTTALAGPKNASATSRQISLDGTASTSADGKPLSYLWSIPEGQGNPSAAILQSGTATPTVQFGTARGTYTFRLTITDSTGASASDVVTVDFEGN
jgi:probable HAF family extracellular repeat protein